MAGSGSVMSGLAKITVTEVRGGGGGGQCQSGSDKRARCAAAGSVRGFFLGCFFFLSDETREAGTAQAAAVCVGQGGAGQWRLSEM